MICPHCLETIADGSTFCPKCHAYVGASDRPHFVFCEGCGARLSSHDRTCPKCGRPAPGILSTESASSDLAAGKTASFPRLTRSVLGAEGASAHNTSVAEVVDSAVDPSATNVLNLNYLRDRQRHAAVQAPEEDPYHTKRRSFKGLFAALAIVAVVGGAAAFVVYDPLAVMPGFYAWFERSAQEAFPTRQASEVGSAPVESVADSEQDAADDGTVSDADAFAVLSRAYNQILAYDSDSQFGEVVNSFNSSYLAADLAKRKAASESAYALRDSIQKTMDELDALNLAEDSVYTQDRDNVRQLAEWMYGRVDEICRSWDVSLDIPEGELPRDHQDEILAPMRETGTDDLQNFDAHLLEYKPVQK